MHVWVPSGRATSDLHSTPPPERPLKLRPTPPPPGRREQVQPRRQRCGHVGRERQRHMDPPPPRGTTHRSKEPGILTTRPPPGAHRTRPVMAERRPVRDGAAVPAPEDLHRPTAPVEPGRPGHLAHLAQRVGHSRCRCLVPPPRGIINRSRSHQTQRPSPVPTASTPEGYHKGDHSKRPGRRRPRASCCHLPPPRLERTDRNYSTTRPGPAPDAPAGGPPATPGLPGRGPRVKGVHLAGGDP